MEEKKQCNYIGCEKEAEVKGFVLRGNSTDDPLDNIVDLVSCEFHAKKTGFFITGKLSD